MFREEGSLTEADNGGVEVAAWAVRKQCRICPHLNRDSQVQGLSWPHTAPLASRCLKEAHSGDRGRGRGR